nr:uncharacterized protein LOC112006071 [Quercus suber]
MGREERMWRQRSRFTYITEGDRNTCFFHSRATQRKRRNCIKNICNHEDEMCTDQEQIAATFVEFYKHLFTSSTPEMNSADLDSIPQVVTREMNEILVGEFQEWEVEAALNQMGPLKAPGPDGMPPLFYQKFWHLVRGDVIQTVLLYLNSDSLPNPLNHTFITLIPKTKNPERVSEFRPISLCHVLYKIFSKVLANRLKRVLPHIISEHQSAFIKGRLITDNILVAYETLHYMKNHNSGKSGFMALKLDMSKAYDRVKWSFLKNVMLQMGFDVCWVTLVMECITTVTYSILINGEPMGDIKPSRGIRQGDPLSPYLFLVCSEGLHRMIQRAACNGDIKGVSICRNGPKLTHLFFADDSLLFCRATIQECRKVMEILATYERVSGQRLNREKTALFFSKSTALEHQSQIMDELGVSKLKQYEEYLGLPAMVGRHKKASFGKIKQRVWKRLQGWEGKLLSQAGREVLIKSVIQAIPTYTMSCFKFPITLCHEIEARFFPTGTFLEAKDSVSASYAWRSIIKGRDVIQKGAIWRVGDGQQIRIWGDNWLPMKGMAKVTSPQIRGQVNSSVASLINKSTNSWRTDVIEHVFEPAEAAIIKAIPLSSFSQRDKLIWPFTLSGQYTVKLGYRFLYEGCTTDQAPADDSLFWKKIWGLEVPNKVKNFVWRACREALPTKANLYRRKIAQDALCDSCKVRFEDGSHSIFFCSNVQVVWRSDPKWNWLSALEGQSMKDIFNIASTEKKDIELLAFTGWAIWNRRNQVRLKKAACPLDQIQAAIGEENRIPWYQITHPEVEQIPLPATISQVEALAARRAATLAVELGITSAVLEGDSDNVYKDLSSHEPSLALHGHIIHDVKLMTSHFSCILFTHIRRQGNSVAHALARRAINSLDQNIWMDNVPPDILHVLQADSVSLV